MLNVNRMALNVIVCLILILYIVVSTTTAEAETLLGISEVFMVQYVYSAFFVFYCPFYAVLRFDEKLQDFKSTGICYLLELGSSSNHKKFKLNRNGPMYDLCYAGSYVSGINDGKVMCKACPDDTYNPFMNACPYCLVCRMCGQNQHEVTTCTRTSDRTCQCALGRSCPPGYPNEVIWPTDVSTRTEITIKQNFNPLYSNTSTTTHDTCVETIWRKRFIVCAAVAGCLIVFLMVVICVLWRSKSYQPVNTDEIQMNGINHLENRTMCQTDTDDGDIRRLIEELTKQISKDYKKIGINLKISEDELDQILLDNHGKFVDAVRAMLNEARKRNGSRTRHVFIQAFQESGRTDLVEKVQTDMDKLAGRRSSASTALVEEHSSAV